MGGDFPFLFTGNSWLGRDRASWVDKTRINDELAELVAAVAVFAVAVVKYFHVPTYPAIQHFRHAWMDNSLAMLPFGGFCCCWVQSG